MSNYGSTMLPEEKLAYETPNPDDVAAGLASNENLAQALEDAMHAYRRWELWRRSFAIVGFAFLLAIMLSGLALALEMTGAQLCLGIFFALFAIAKLGDGICAGVAAAYNKPVVGYLAAYDEVKNTENRNANRVILGNIFLYLLPSLGMVFINLVMASYWLNASLGSLVFLDKIVALTTLTGMLEAIPWVMLFCMICTAVGTALNHRDSERQQKPWYLASNSAFYLQIGGLIPTAVVLFKFNMFMGIAGAGLAASAAPIIPIVFFLTLVLILAIIAIVKFSHRVGFVSKDEALVTPTTPQSQASSSSPALDSGLSKAFDDVGAPLTPIAILADIDDLNDLGQRASSPLRYMAERTGYEAYSERGFFSPCAQPEEQQPLQQPGPSNEL